MVFLGIAVGGEYTAIFAAIDELIPIKDRGKVDIIIDGTWFNNNNNVLYFLIFIKGILVLF